MGEASKLSSSESGSTAAGPDLPSSSGVRALDVRDANDLYLREIVVVPEPDVAEGAGEELRVEFARETQFFAGLSDDVACGGLLVATYRVLPVGTAVRLAFELPGGTRIEARGTVRWIREEDTAADRCGLAIAFTEISKDALRQIAEFCRLRPPLFLDL